MEITNFFNQINPSSIFEFILHPQITGWFLVIKILFIIISLVLITAIFWLLNVSTWFKKRYTEDVQEFRSFSPVNARANMKQWKKILSRLETEKEIQYRLAVIEADEFMENILKVLNYEGKDLSEKLTHLDKEVLPNIEELKDAHKVRNDIVFNRDFKLDITRAKQVLDIYFTALKNLRVI